MPKILVLCVCTIVMGFVACASQAQHLERSFSDIKADETVVFFRTSAWLDDLTDIWHVPIHGWIYEPEDSTVRKALFAAVLDRQYGLAPTEDTDANFSRRFGLIIADNERNKKIVIEIAGQIHTLPLSGPNGHFETTLQIPAARAERFIDGSVIRYSAVTDEKESRSFVGEVMLVTPTGLSIISDIDDTVKISDVVDRMKLLENTFLLDFAAAPGMSDLFSEWVEKDVSLHYVSSSPWQLYAPLEEFLAESGFPRGQLNLKLVRFRDETLLDLFKEGIETKPASIERILNTYPNRRFVLVGDSGEQDPEVYVQILRSHPEQIVRIFIRNVTEESPDNERFSRLFAKVDSNVWQLFDEPLGLQLP